ncbi:hypothetical protein J1TS5_04220 [Paenibacillus macerans]|uniref:hypothetical protein n=1 Tax=Paenibacillus macerans TaxID=44252 RepID=UPI001B148BAF|nr:hypothetical protein [Paenibacillus macerans]GIP08252.1 hypothetical protein J1TS5_04220 [Paenibacillus macerans]
MEEEGTVKLGRKNIVINFHFGNDDDDAYELNFDLFEDISLQLNESERRERIEVAIQTWIRENVSYDWEEAELEDEEDDDD